MYSFNRMDNKTAQEIINWHYTEPYDFYDLRTNDDELDYWEYNIKNNIWKDTYAITNSGTLVGFFKVKHDVSSIDLTLALHPDYVGKNIGYTVIGEIIDFIKANYGDNCNLITACIVSYNKRAINTFLKLGFKAVSHIPRSINGILYDYTCLEKDL